MRNVRTFFVMFFCAGLATGMFTSNLNAAAQPCQPSFTKIDPAEVKAGATVNVTLTGSCMAADISIGFSADPAKGLGDIPVRGISFAVDKIVLSLDIPSDKKISRRQLSVKIGGEVKKTAIFLKIVPEGTATASTEVEYVTKPVLWAAIRKVDAKADRAIGMAQENQKAVASVRTDVEVLQSANVRVVEKFKEYFGDGTEEDQGSFGTRLSKVENGLSDQIDAIKQMRTEIDTLNRRPVSSTGAAFDPAPLYERMAKLEGQVQRILDTKVKTGMFGRESLGKAAGVKDGPGYVNPIQ